MTPGLCQVDRTLTNTGIRSVSPAAATTWSIPKNHLPINLLASLLHLPQSKKHNFTQDKLGWRLHLTLETANQYHGLAKGI